VLQVMTETQADLVLTPQFFSNTEPGADIFNNDNIQFWKVSHPFTSAPSRHPLPC
jgi:hypothetical protein